jgi:hypothetical protein
MVTREIDAMSICSVCNEREADPTLSVAMRNGKLVNPEATEDWVGMPICRECHDAPRCFFGSAYADMRCPNIAIWFYPDLSTYGALCDEHHDPNDDELVRKGENLPPVKQRLRNYWIDMFATS